MVSALLIGNGKVGRAARARGEARGWQFSVIDQNPGDWRSAPLPDVAFLAIPSGDGIAASEYIRHFAGAGVPVVTCEKGALAERFDEVRPLLGKVGYDATVGGGTRMLKYLRGRPKDQIVSIFGVLNGTLNFLACEIEAGAKPEDATREAVLRGYAEPGAISFGDVVAGEVGDLCRKARILANVSGFCEASAPAISVDASAAAAAIAEKPSRRFLAAMTKEDFPGGVATVTAPCGEWRVQVGVFETERLPFALPTGVNNVLAIQETTGVFSVSGPGAGPEATAAAMVEEAGEMVGKN